MSTKEIYFCDICNKQLSNEEYEVKNEIYLEINDDNNGGYIEDPEDICSECSNKIANFILELKKKYIEILKK